LARLQFGITTLFHFIFVPTSIGPRLLGRLAPDGVGAPLAMEGLAAFFLESTFLGLWLF